MQSYSSKLYDGIDISQWKEHINYSKVKNAGYNIAIIKATEGVNYIDPMFEVHYRGCKAAGIKIGFYHFMSDKTDPAQQANDFWKAIKNKSFDVIPVLDIEKETRGRNKEAVTDRCLEFLKEFKRLSGYDCIVYTYTSFAIEKLDNRLAPYLLWIAHYGVNQPKDNGIWSKWVGFQYTDKKNVPSIPQCDANKFTKEIFIDSAPKINVSSSHTTSTDNLWEEEISGKEVSDLQHQINVQGFGNVSEDGYFGRKTLNACPLLKKGAKGKITKLVQQRLLNRGYTSLKPYGATGYFGDVTEKAIMHLQKNFGLSVDGDIGHDTWIALYKKQ